jgi:hypothetical protein
MAAPKRNDTMPNNTDTRPPHTGAEEKATLLGFLDYLRAAIAAKAEGVPEPQIRTPGVPTGTSLLGLVKHLTCVERFYFLGEDVDDWKATLHPTPDETIDGVLADYREAVRRANQVIEACTDLTQPRPEGPATAIGTVDALGPGPHDRGNRAARGTRRYPARTDRRCRRPLNGMIDGCPSTPTR